MANHNKERKVKLFRLALTDGETHKQLWALRFNHTTLIISIISLVLLILAISFSIIAFTPIKSLIPGYPDAVSKRAAIQNAMKIDSLEAVLFRWELYTENLRRVVEGKDAINIDSLINNKAESISNPEQYQERDSLLREIIKNEEKFDLNSNKRDLPIDGMLFFSPLTGVISQGYDKYVHPFIDITAPANTPIKAVLDGTVIFAGWNDDSGHTIQIQHMNDIVSIYKHNEKLLKKVGDRVSAGTAIAIIGNTGKLSTGQHLHFELWYQGEAVDPTKYINF